MGVRWLRIGLLLIAMILIHEMWMATSGHDLARAEPVPGCEPIEHHHHGQDQANPVSSRPLDMAEVCSDIEAVAPFNREMHPALADLPAALRSDSAIAMLFASTSRTIVETPPAHPPDVIRALFQVYLI